MVGVPSWLYYLLGVLMLAVAAYGATLLGLSASANRAAGRDVEVSHVAMGLAMAGMFVPAWVLGPSWLWELVFIALLVWFVFQSVQSIRAWGLHVPHYTVHAAMSFAMLLMYWFAGVSSSGAMSMSTRSSGRLDPGLALLVAFVLFGSAIFTVASPNKGATHYGTHGSNPLAVAASDGHEDRRPQTLGVEQFIETPSLLDASHVVMCVAMGFMLILLI